MLDCGVYEKEEGRDPKTRSTISAVTENERKTTNENNDFESSLRTASDHCLVPDNTFNIQGCKCKESDDRHVTIAGALIVHKMQQLMSQ